MLSGGSRRRAFASTGERKNEIISRRALHVVIVLRGVMLHREYIKENVENEDAFCF